MIRQPAIPMEGSLSIRPTSRPNADLERTASLSRKRMYFPDARSTPIFLALAGPTFDPRLTNLMEPDLRESLDGAVGRSVVNDHHLVSNTTLASQVMQAPEHFIEAIPVDDDDTDERCIGHLCDAPRRKAPSSREAVEPTEMCSCVHASISTSSPSPIEGRKALLTRSGSESIIVRSE